MKVNTDLNIDGQVIANSLIINGKTGNDVLLGNGTTTTISGLGDGYVTGLTFTGGTLTVQQTGGSATNETISLDGRYMLSTGGTFTGSVTVPSLTVNGDINQNPTLFTTTNTNQGYRFLKIQNKYYGFAQTTYWNGSSYTTALDVIGIGEFALQNNTGYNASAFGNKALQGNTGNFPSAFGTNAMRYNTANFCSGFGANALQNNTGSSATGVGYNALQSNTGVNVTSLGHNSFQQNKGSSSVGIGNNAGQYNTGTNTVTIGENSAKYNSGSNNTVVGANSFSTFIPNSGSSKTFSSADITIATNIINIPSHGFGSVGTYKNVRFTTSSSAPSGLSNNSVYIIRIVDSSNVEVTSGIFTQGSGTHSFIPQLEYSNVSILGNSIQPERSNQTLIGGLSIKAPSVSISEINSVGAKALITKEYLDSKGYATSGVVFVTNVASLPGTGAPDTLYVAKTENTLHEWNGSSYDTLGGSQSSVEFYADVASLPGTGTTDKLYVAKAENNIYEWNGSSYDILGGGTETDPVFTASPAFTISSADITNWDGKANVEDVPQTIEAYITDGTAQGLLENTSNWDVDGVYIGTAITGTFKGQRHYDAGYFFEAVSDNNWIRYPRG